MALYNIFMDEINVALQKMTLGSTVLLEYFNALVCTREVIYMCDLDKVIPVLMQIESDHHSFSLTDFILWTLFSTPKRACT